jgi:hypothetical protein
MEGGGGWRYALEYVSTSKPTAAHAQTSRLSYKTTYASMGAGKPNAALQAQARERMGHAQTQGKTLSPQDHGLQSPMSASPRRLAESTEIYTPYPSALSPISPRLHTTQAGTGARKNEQGAVNDVPFTVSKIFLGTAFKRGGSDRVAGREIRHKSICRQGKKITPPTFIETLEETERLGTGEIMRTDLFQPRIWPLRSPRTASDMTDGSPRAAWGMTVGVSPRSPTSAALGLDMRNSCRHYWHEFRGPDPLPPLPIEPFRPQLLAA